MPYVYTEPEVFHEYAGVPVYHVYDGGDGPWKYWYTTDPDTADECNSHGNGGHFDVRMFVAAWSDTPTVQQWDDYWKPRFKTEDECIRALIDRAIDDKKIFGQP